MPSISNTTISPQGMPVGGVYNSSAIVRAAGEGLYAEVAYGYSFGTADPASTVIWDPTGDNQLMSLVENQVMTANRNFATYWLPNPASVKTGIIRVTFPGANNDNCWLRASHVLTHDGGPVIGSAKRQEPSPTTNNLSITLPAAVGELVIAAVCMRDIDINLTNGNLNDYSNAVVVAGSRTAVRGTRPGAASVTATVNYSPTGTNYDNAIIAARIGAGAPPPDTTPPIITGPSGVAGAATSAITIAENTPVVTTMAANESVTWSKSGTDALLVNIGAGTGVVTLAAGAGANFEDPTDAGANNTIVVVITATDPSANASSQTLTITVINANEAPVFVGPSISIPSGVAGAAITPVALAALWTDPDAGDTAAYTQGGTWPGSLSIVSGQITGSYPATVGTVSGLTVNRVDAGGLSTPSNAFSVTSTAGAPRTVTTLPFTRNPGTGSAPVSLPGNSVAVLTDAAGLALIANASALTMGADGRVSLTSGALPAAGASVVVVTMEADGKLGVDRRPVV